MVGLERARRRLGERDGDFDVAGIYQWIFSGETVDWRRVLGGNG